ncbi:MAG: metalloprotease [Patescibacteria group bacterium]|jgi:regulator of sigma E protease|nr:metalloprotease [Patescibacteria group bacterium]
MSILLLIVGLLLFVGLVVVHEYGHYLAARKGGVEVEEFGIGFPPRAWGRKLKSGMDFTLNWLPLGGFVKLKGEHDSATAKGSFGAAPLGTKVKIMLAGVGMNLLTAFIIFTFLALIGIPKLIDNQFTVSSDTRVTQSRVIIGSVEANSPASKSGMQVQDEVVGISNNDSKSEIDSAAELSEVTKNYAGEQVTITVIRDDQQKELQTELRSKEEVEASKKTDNPKGYLGVSPAELTIQRSTWSAPIVAAGLIKQFTVMTLKGLGTAIKGLGSIIAGVLTGNTQARQNGQSSASSQVSGPIGIIVVMNNISELGISFVLMIIGLISLTLAIMNALPIPALDGGRLFVTLLFKAMRKPLTQSMEEKIHGTGFLVLMVLIVLITIVDVKRLPWFN